MLKKEDNIMMLTGFIGRYYKSDAKPLEIIELISKINDELGRS
jgi:hypothetical protein